MNSQTLSWKYSTYWSDIDRVQTRRVLQTIVFRYREIGGRLCKNIVKIVWFLLNKYYDRNKIFFDIFYTIYPRILCCGTLWLAKHDVCVVKTVRFYTTHFYVWTNGKKRNISYFFAIGWNRRALYPWVCKLRLWDWGMNVLLWGGGTVQYTMVEYCTYNMVQSWVHGNTVSYSSVHGRYSMV
jgi:hypothetical protein